MGKIQRMANRVLLLQQIFLPSPVQLQPVHPLKATPKGQEILIKSVGCI